MKVRLSSAEREQLMRMRGADGLVFEPTPSGDHVSAIPDDLADDLRERCADELLTTGFDQDYEPTPEGKVLESLIDKLYIA